MVQRRQDQVTTQAGAKASVSTFNFYPVGRAVQAAVCRTAEAGAIPARDSISSSIGVERYTPCGRPQGPSKPEYRARYPDARPFLATRTGVSQDFTGLVAAVQLRHRVAFGLQALQRCSGLLNRRARGSTVATHHFADVAQQRQQQFRKLPGTLPHESASLSIGSISASVVKLQSSSASNGEFAGGSPVGCTNSRACGSTRIAEGPDSESGSLGGASPFMPTISRRLASAAGRADRGDLKSASLPGASP